MKTGTQVIALVLFSGNLLLPQVTWAGSSSWTNNAGSAWITAGNWDSGVPGVSGGSSSTDIATFSAALTAGRTVTVDANRNIGGITFGNTSAFPFTLNTGPLLLTSGGVVQNLAGTGDHTDYISAPTVIQGIGGSATVHANAVSASSILRIGGVTGVSTAGNTTTLNLDGANTALNNISGVIGDGSASGNLAVIKNGTGLWYFSSVNNTFSGGLTINSGLMVGANNSFGVGPVTLNGGAVASANSNARVWTNDIVVGGDFTLGQAVTYVGVLTFSGNMDLGGTTRQITVANPSTTGNTLSGALSNGGLTKAGVGTLVLSGSNTYSGSTSISDGIIKVAAITVNLGGTGTINLGAGSATGTLITVGATNETVTRAINLAGTTGGGTIQNDNTADGALTFSGDFGATGTGSKTLTLKGTSGGNNIINGVISDGAGVVGLTISDSDWRLSGSNTFSGPVNVTGGTARPANNTAFGTGTVTFDGGAWALGASIVVSNAIILGAGRNVAGNSGSSIIEFASPISGSGNFKVNGFTGGRTKLSGNNSGWSGNWIFSGNNQLLLNHTNALGTGTTLTFSDGVSSMGTVDALIDLSGGNGLTQNIILGTTGASSAFPTFKTTANLKLSGVISGPAGIGLIKTGAGVLTLANTNTYSGRTTVSAGTLQLAADYALPPGGAVTLAGGTMDMGTFVNTLSSLTVTNSCTLVLGAGQLAFTNQSDVAWSGGTLTLTNELALYTLRFQPALTPDQLGRISYAAGKFYSTPDGYLRAFPRGTIIRVL
jgi:autotransporter-associated beta strand protein